MDTLEQDRLVVSEEEAGIRLDRWLALRFKDRSRTYFQSLIEDGHVLVNGTPSKKREKTCDGDEIEVCFALTPELSLEAEEIPLDILYEDEDLLVVNKPAGMVVHPAPGHPRGTFVNALLHHCRSLTSEIEDPLRPGIVHRLDKDTSGALIAAKTAFAHTKLVEAFAKREIQKTYLAVAVGKPPVSKVETLIKRHPTKRQEMTVSEEGGKPAVTLIQELERGEKTSLLEIALITGRTHQIRVHLRHIGCPILGDDLYGSPSFNRRYGAERQLLHASRLLFAHPRTGKILEIQAPVPGDMEPFVKQLP